MSFGWGVILRKTLPVLCIGVGVLPFFACSPATSPGTTSAPSSYTVTYMASGATAGSAPTDSAKYQEGSLVTVLGNTGGMAKTGCSFSGWNAKLDGTGNSYAVGATFAMGSAGVALYAQWAAIGTPLQATGIGLVSWGGNLYILGGLDASGAYRSEVWRSAVGTDGSLGAWTREAFNLPQGLAFASCVAFGKMIYVIGGRNSSGLINTIYFTMINSDGSLGFTSGWATNARTLPVARSGAAPLVYEGRIFLFGGETAIGTTSSIIDAGIWNDHELGQWYATANPLPSAGEGYAAANYDGAFWVVGGNMNAAYSASPDGNGLPGLWTSGGLAGGAALYPALASTADGLVMLGGSDSSSTSYAQTRLYNGSTWAPSAAIATFGPHSAIVAGTLFAPGNVEGSAAPSIQTRTIATDRADAPRVSPGGGVMKTGSSPTVVAYPGDTIRYTTATHGTTPADPATGAVWNTASPPTISVPTTYAFRAFHSGAQPSEIVYASYHTLSSSMFMLLKDTLYPNSSAITYTPYSLTETYSNGSSTAVLSVWYRIIVSTRSTVSLGWADKTTNAVYVAAIRLSLFEDVGCSTPVQGTDGSELYQLASGSANPSTATLGPGTYYLLVESTNGGTGGSFGLLVGEGA